MHRKGKKLIAKILGNFGVAFFSPLISVNIGENMFDLAITLHQMLVISLISATAVTGMSISKEYAEWGKGERIVG